MHQEPSTLSLPGLTRPATTVRTHRAASGPFAHPPRAQAAAALSAPVAAAAAARSPPVHVERRLQLLAERAHLGALAQQLAPQPRDLALQHVHVGGARAQHVQLAPQVGEADLQDADLRHPAVRGTRVG